MWRDSAIVVTVQVPPCLVVYQAALIQALKKEIGACIGREYKATEHRFVHGSGGPRPNGLLRDSL